MSTSMHPSLLDSAERALPPPAAVDAHAAGDERAVRRRAHRYRAAMVGAIASALVAVAVFDRALSPGVGGALTAWLLVLAGLGAAGLSVLLGRVAYRSAGDEDAHDGPPAVHADGSPSARG